LALRSGQDRILHQRVVAARTAEAYRMQTAATERPTGYDSRIGAFEPKRDSTCT
jgi:hypothetical protein